LIAYGIFLGLAASSLNRVVNGQPDSKFECAVYQTTITDGNKKTTVEIDPYFCSLGLYTEALIFSNVNAVRLPVLCVSIAIFALLIICAILLFVALCTEISWLLAPWLGIMALDVIRGIIFCILIFVWSDSDIRKIAVGIFFLGLQLFHMSLMLIIYAKMQRMRNKERGIEYRIERTGDKSVLVDGANMYPTLPSGYAYSESPHYRRAGYFQPYNTMPPPRDYRGPPPGRAIEYHGQQPGPSSTLPRDYQQQNFGRTM